MSLPWKEPEFQRKWASKPAQTVNSPEYKELKKYIHMPYRKIDHMGVKCYYFPTYCVFKIKNITEFDFDSLSARINGVLVIKMRVDYQDHFSPYDQNKDQQSVRKAIQDLFKITFNKIKQAQNSPMKRSNQCSSIKKENKSQNKPVEEEQNSINVNNKFLYIQFNRDDPLRLPSKRVFQGQIKQEQQVNEEGTFIIWTIRKQFKIALRPGTWVQDLIAPFNLLNYELTLSFEDIDVNIDTPNIKKSSLDLMNPGGKQLVKFKFNCMKRVGNNSPQQKKHIYEQLRFTDDGTLGEYDLAQTELSVSCQKYLSKQHDSDISSEYRSYKVINFNIPFYKYPIMDSLTIFIPLVLITILTLFTFVQGPDFNDKIGNIATLMIVYVGLMPVISDSLPATTSLTLIDIVVYCQLLISVLCLIRGYIIKDYTVQQFNNYFVWQDHLFRLSVAIAIITGCILTFLLIYYCINKKYNYNLQQADLDEIDHKLTHWVSPHMHNIARNIKTSIEKQKLKGQEPMISAGELKSETVLKNIKSQHRVSAEELIKKNNEGIILSQEMISAEVDLEKSSNKHSFLNFDLI